MFKNKLNYCTFYFVDMDACWLDCGSNATCVNTNVNSTCECDSGFEGTYPACNGSY